MTCQDCWDLHVAEKKSNGTGGAVHDADKRYYNELTRRRPRRCSSRRTASG